jgi:hypothetical protein
MTVSMGTHFLSVTTIVCFEATLAYLDHSASGRASLSLISDWIEY